MASQRITIRVPKELGAKLREQTRTSGRTPSDVVRAALESYLDRPQSSGSAYEAAKAAGLIGIARGLPRDLSTNRAYFKDFGRGK